MTFRLEHDQEFSITGVWAEAGEILFVQRISAQLIFLHRPRFTFWSQYLISYMPSSSGYPLAFASASASAHLDTTLSAFVQSRIQPPKPPFACVLPPEVGNECCGERPVEVLYQPNEHLIPHPKLEKGNKTPPW